MDPSITTKIRTVHPNAPDPDILRAGAKILRDGGVVVFPTQCLYGLGAAALTPAAVDRIFAIKQRPTAKPLLVLISHEADLLKLAKAIPPAARRIMEALWPGSVTLVFEANPGLPPALTAGSGKIGIRLPQHPVARELVRRAGMPITGTSANLSGAEGCMRVSDLAPDIGRQVDLIMDAGPLKGGTGSTIIDVTMHPPRILREGVVATHEVNKALGP